MILVIDNHDSFTWTIVDYLRVLGAELAVRRSDALSAADALASGPRGFVISPGPGRPENAGVSLDLVAACAAAARPLLGICLGHQAIGQHYGARVVHAERPVHGKAGPLDHDGSGLFAGLPSPLVAARYHSLVIDPATMPACLRITATAADATVQALRHETLPIHGVQFHPESVASEFGHRLLGNFLALVARS